MIDDCSTDDSYRVLKELESQDSRIKLLRMEKNKGPAVARNVGIANAKGRYIAFLDSDDLWFPEKLEKQIAFMNVKGAALSFTGYQKIDECGFGVGRIVSVPESIDYLGLLNASVIACLTVLYDTKIIGKVLMPESKVEDYGLWLKILKMGYVAHGLNQPLASLRKRRGSVSSNKLRAALWVWRLYRDSERLSLCRSSYHFINYAVRALIKAGI